MQESKCFKHVRFNLYEETEKSMRSLDKNCIINRDRNSKNLY